MPFSRGSSPPKDQTCISVSPALAGKFFNTVPLGKPSVHFGYEKLTLCLSTCSYLHLTLLPLCLCISHSVMSDSLRPRGPNLARLPCPWNSPGQNTGVGSRSLLQVIFPTQGSNQGLLHCRWILYQLSYQGSPKKKIKGSVSHIETE